MDKRENINYKILIVDDMPKNIQVLGNVLRGENYDIYFANSGRAALIQIEHNNFDLILLDVMMPEMNGYEVCEMLQGDDKTKDIPIIFLTAKNDTESIVEGFKRGASDYVTKPFEPAELLSRVKTQISLKNARDELKRANEKMKAELDFAKAIHAKIVTFDTPKMEKFNVYAGNISIGGLGGDFIEVIKLDDGSTGIAFVDVSGHGVSAALMVSALKFIISTNFKGIKSTSKALYLLNEMINQTFIGEGITLSIAYMIIDDASGNIKITSCSQEDILVLRQDSLGKVSEKGIILGVLDNELIEENEDICFRDVDITLETGDKLFMYTDGLVEAEFMDREKFKSILNEIRRYSGKDIVKYFNTEFKPKLMEEEKDDTTYLIIEKK